MNRWWKVLHLDSGKVGFIREDRVAIETDHPPSKTTLNELLLEMLDVVLENSFLHWVLNPSFHQKDEDVIKTLSSVDFCWFQRISRPRFKNRIWRRLKEFFGKTRKISSIIRNNRNYLLDNIQPNDELIASLLSLNCITKEHSHFIQRQRSTRAKNGEILHQMKSFDETKFSNFFKCLRQTNQKTVARTMENGGGVMKVEVQYRSANCTTSREAQLLFRKNIEDLRNRTKLWSRQTDKLISQLREEGIDILNSQLDRQTVVVWIWCHSQEALKHIQRVYESNQLRDVLFGVVNMLPFTPEINQSKVINMDSNQFKKAVVVRPIFINFTQAIDKGRDELVYGVTKLRSEIYVICQLSSTDTYVIRVFEDRNPFNLQKKKIEIKEIKSPKDIGSSEKENCLYVPDYEEKCVWKITRETDDEPKIIKWLTLDFKPLTLSLSSKGQLLLANISLSSLMIYGSDAELVRSIQLPRDNGYPYRAVETSIGNFIIIYLEKSEEQDDEEEKKEGEEEEKEKQKEEEEKQGEENEPRGEEKEGDSGSRGRNSIKVEKEEEEEATEGGVEEREEEDMEEKREEMEDEELGEGIEGESGSNGRNSIKVEKEEDVEEEEKEEEEKEEEGGKRDRVEEKEKKSGSSGRKKKRNRVIIELSRDGQMVRRFVPSNKTQQLNDPCYLSLDSDDQVFVADLENERVILLNSDLKWNRILCPTKEETKETKITWPHMMCYDEEKKQLIVGGDGVNVYTFSRK